MKRLLMVGLCAGSLFLLPSSMKAQPMDPNCPCSGSHMRADKRAPIGIMGDHMHKKGKWMLSYRYMNMSMSGLRDGTTDLSAQHVVTTVPNRFAGLPMQPATLRVAPQKMEMNMHMIGAMATPTDDITLMAMTNYTEKKMRMTVFQGATGTNVLGTSSASSKGLGDLSLSALIRLYEDDTHHVHLNTGVSLPTGSTSRAGTMLMPNNMRMHSRLAYGMQLGSGTHDLLPGITYTGHKDNWGWGGQYAATLRLGHNDENYSLGNKHQLALWGSYLFNPAVSISARLTGEHEGKIDGIDSNIIGPSPAADPNNYGGDRLSTGIGINTLGTKGALKGHRFSAEITLPIYQNLNGPQLKREPTFMIGWGKSF